MPLALRVRSDDPRTSAPTLRRDASPLRVVAVVVSCVVALVGSVGWTWHRRQVDIQVYLMGARHLTSAHLYSLYLPGVHLPFTYPPFSTLFFWPLTWIPSGAAGVVWSLVNVTALVLVLAVTLLHVRPELRANESRVPWMMVLLLLGPAVLIEPAMLGLSFGQINLVLLALVVVDATTRVQVAGRTLPRGIGIGLAAAIKLVPFIFVPFLLVTRQFRAALTALVTAGLCTLAAFVVNPSASAAFWTKYVNDQSRIGTVTYVSNQSLEGALDRVTHHVWSPHSIEAVEVVAALAGLALAWWAWRVSSTFLAVMVVGDAGLLVSPITWAHHMVWVVPVLAWLWWGRDRPASGRVWAIVVAALFYVAPMWILAHGPTFDTHERGVALVADNSFTVAAIGFVAAVAAILTLRRRRAATSPR
ncbi:MAG TPA: glycosyltransferase 87 family protein [Acidimicrobiales bacterium]